MTRDSIQTYISELVVAVFGKAFSKSINVMWSLASQSAYRMLLGQECSQNLAPLSPSPQPSFLSIIVILIPSVSGACWVSMETEVQH